MRAALFGVVAVAVLMLAVTVYEVVHTVHEARVNHPGAQVGIDLTSLVHMTLSPRFWVLYARGFIVAAFLAARGT